jgi:hypothetical protein
MATGSYLQAKALTMELWSSIVHEQMLPELKLAVEARTRSHQSAPDRSPKSRMLYAPHWPSFPLSFSLDRQDLGRRLTEHEAHLTRPSPLLDRGSHLIQITQNFTETHLLRGNICSKDRNSSPETHLHAFTVSTTLISLPSLYMQGQTRCPPVFPSSYKAPRYPP